MINQRFTKLTVLHKAGKAKNRHTQWHCQCDCGKLVTVTGDKLRSEHTKSCGCLRQLQLTTHGQSRTKIHNIWCSMLARCRDLKNHRYGGRGLTVCNEWQNFETFAHDMGQPPKGFTLERKNNDLGYSKENCEWANRKKQGRNRCDNIFIEHDGKRMTMIEWAELLNVPHRILWSRLKIYNWSIIKTLTTPIKVYHKVRLS